MVTNGERQPTIPGSDHLAAYFAQGVNSGVGSPLI